MLVRSLFWLHNETVNIWSHLVGFAYFSLLFVRTLWTPPDHISTTTELVPVLIQLVSYQLCMLSSTLFHTFNCHSEDAHRSWLQLDHLGILMALFGSYVSFIYDAFYCHPVSPFVCLLFICRCLQVYLGVPFSRSFHN